MLLNNLLRANRVLDGDRLSLGLIGELVGLGYRSLYCVRIRPISLYLDRFDHCVPKVLAEHVDLAWIGIFGDICYPLQREFRRVLRCFS